MVRPYFFLGPGATPAPVRVPASVVSVLYNSLPLIVMSYGFWDQYADHLQSQSLSAYKGNVVEEYDFIIGNFISFYFVLGLSETKCCKSNCCDKCLIWSFVASQLVLVPQEVC